MTISLANAYNVQGNDFMVDGYVSDESPNTVAVSFGGAFSGTVMADASGYFSLTSTVANLGNVQIAATDEEELSSATYDLLLTDSPPELSIGNTTFDGSTVTIDGTISDANPGGASVSFSGVVSGGASPDQMGSFTAVLPVSELGDIHIVATDLWGQLSAVVTVPITSNPPTMYSWIEYGEQKEVSIHGQVDDENPSGLIVSLTGSATGFALTDSMGFFTWTGDADSLGTVQLNVVDELTSGTCPQTSQLKSSARFRLSHSLVQED